MKIVVLSLIIIALVTSCGKDHKHNEDPVKKIVVNNPLKIIENTETNSNVSLSNSLNTNNGRLVLDTIFIFESEEHKNEEKKKSTEAGNESAEEREEKVYTFSLTKDQNKLEIISDDKNLINLKFNSDVKKGYNLNTLNYFGEIYQKEDGLELIHFSENIEHKAISFLVKFNDKELGGRPKVVAFYFYSQTNEIKKYETLDKKYKFLNGEGDVVRWNKDKNIVISVCSKNTVLSEGTQIAVNSWGEPLKEAGVNLTINKLEGYPPFSDLNNHCVYEIDDMRTIQEDKYFNTASTYLFNNLETQKIITADILSFTHEQEKIRAIYKKDVEEKGGVYNESVVNDYIDNNLKETMVHEVGHFLGLDHNFTGTKSVMSYDDKSLTLFEYDKEAIKALYLAKEEKKAEEVKEEESEDESYKKEEDQESEDDKEESES